MKSIDAAKSAKGSHTSPFVFCSNANQIGQSIRFDCVKVQKESIQSVYAAIQPPPPAVAARPSAPRRVDPDGDGDEHDDDEDAGAHSQERQHPRVQLQRLQLVVCKKEPSKARQRGNGKLSHVGGFMLHINSDISHFTIAKVPSFLTSSDIRQSMGWGSGFNTGNQRKLSSRQKERYT